MNIVVEKHGFAIAAKKVLSVYCNEVKELISRKKKYCCMLEYIDPLDERNSFVLSFSIKAECDEFFYNVLKIIKNAEEDLES